MKRLRWQAMPAIRIQDGDINGAVSDMAQLGLSPAMQRAVISSTLQPHLSRQVRQVEFAP